jgi:RND family efflux transporter MFP subunit
MFCRHIFLIPLLLLLFACGKESSSEIKQTLRPIKTVKLQSASDNSELRKFSGTVQAKNITELSFESSGNITKILVDEGDTVQFGQVLAKLDEEPFQLRLNSSQAALNIRESELRKSNRDFKRKKELHVKGFVSEADLEAGLTELENAKLAVKSAQADLALTERELKQSTLYAPFDGTIANRLLNPYTEVGPGIALFEVDADGQMEVELSISENLIEYISTGMEVLVYVASHDDSPIQGVISRIGSQAKEGNAFLVDVNLIKPPLWVSSGMSAEIRINLSRKHLLNGFRLPVQAILPDPEKSIHYVFVYQPETQIVKKTVVEVSGGSDQKAIITSGLKKGDVVAVAGASFLIDGMKVLPPIDSQ